MNEHFCDHHNTKYYRNEKNGKVWYSHKIQGGEGYCNLPREKQTPEPASNYQPAEKTAWSTNTPAKKHDTMLMCNAMNNAVAMVNAGIVHEDALQDKFESILKILESKT